MLVRAEYEQLIYTLPSRYSSIRLSTLVLTPPGLDTARVTGLLLFGDDWVLCVYELLDFQQGVIEAYGYEVSRCHPPFTESALLEAADYCRASNPAKKSATGTIPGRIPMTPHWPVPTPITNTSRLTSNTTASPRPG